MTEQMDLESTEALLARDPCLWWWLDGDNPLMEESDERLPDLWERGVRLAQTRLPGLWALRRVLRETTAQRPQAGWPVMARTLYRVESDTMRFSTRQAATAEEWSRRGATVHAVTRGAHR